MSETVLVTGISGFLGGHVARELLEQGYRVRGTLRNPDRADEVRGSLAQAGCDVSGLELVPLDLLRDEGWDAAVSGCRFVQHIASPFVLRMPRDPNDLIVPAVEGTRRVLRAALRGDVERVVLTSSVAAIDGGQRNRQLTCGPQDWTDLDGPHITAYTRSKTLAERVAWSIMSESGASERLAVINPGTMLGPLLANDPGTSVEIVQRLLHGDMPMLPDLVLPWVDVRDVAGVHVTAMTSPLAGGTRTIVANAVRPLPELAEFLRCRFGEDAKKVPKRRMPNWIARVVALFDPSLRDSRAYLGVHRRYQDNGATLLDRPLRSTEDALTAAAQSLLGR